MSKRNKRNNDVKKDKYEGLFQGSPPKERFQVKKKIHPQVNDSKGKNDNSKTDPQFPSNIGWLYSKDYYKNIEQIVKLKENDQADHFKKKNETITGMKFSAYEEFSKKVHSLNCKNITTLELTTSYPGLLIGSGIPHESGSMGEFKIGFHFDHTTGLPYIPGSSVKGLLRSAFKQVNGEYIAFLLKEMGIQKQVDIEALEKEIFDGIETDETGKEKEKSIYKRDIFFDAGIIKTKNNEGFFLAEDFITPHPSPFKEPIPIMFLKVLPQAVFQFTFRLFDSLMLTAEKKKELFEKIICQLGIGAKTNVGYGKFIKHSKS
jgi:CRISPR-associated protein Cmr6